MDFCAYFSKNLTNQHSIFARLDEKRYLQEILRKFCKIFLRKLQKMHYFSIFFKHFNKPRVQILRVKTKNAMCRKFLRKFSKISEENCEKCTILEYFSKEFNKPYVNFLRDWTKNTIRWKFFRKFSKFWENLLEKIEKNALI